MIFRIGGFLAALLLTSCVTGPTWYDEMRNSGSDYYTARWDGTRTTQRQPDHKITVNRSTLESTHPSNAQLEIDLSEQRARLFKVENGTRRLSVETPISTGKEGYRTPSGQFTILEKLPRKKSTLYGFWVDGNTGAVIDRDGDSRRPPSGRSNLQFRGAPMPNWLRLTNGGIGIHEGFVPEHPASHGCIRVPAKAQQLIYPRVGVGTPVSVRG